MVTSEGAPIAGELFYDADIEPDADRDGYGDVTQDACPSVAATQGACPPRPPPVVTPTPTPVPPGGGAQATTPQISGLEATPARFRVKRRGAVIARARAGTRIRLRLSEPATVAFAVRRRAACRPTRTGCARWRLVHVFERGLAAGPSSIAYSGRYRRRGRVRSLQPGRYRLRAVATNAAGRAGSARRIRLRVRP
jgi:hypothetical protein